MVYQAAHAVKIPVIGMGGIASAYDALEMIMAGATAVAVGTANFRDPSVTGKIVLGIEEYMKRSGVEDIRSLIGCVG
jgi:dihydroorotate dehydrogenase (NAD+) catalytic subunit